MKAPLSPAAFGVIADLVKARSGLIIGPDQGYLLETRLAAILRREKLRDLTALAELLLAGTGDPLARDVVEAMITNETLFFRDTTPFDDFAQRTLPRLLQSRPFGGPLRIWSAAAASGQEAYSIAMILAENSAAIGARQVEILGTDLAREPLARARRGLYSPFEVQRGLSPQMLARHFRQEAGGWRIKPALRAAVTFGEWNLLSDLAPLGRFDVVFCRNVLIYFDHATKARVLDAIARQLAPDGVLYLGGAETVLGLTDRFTAVPDRQVFVPAGSAGGMQEPPPPFPGDASAVHWLTRSAGGTQVARTYRIAVIPGDGIGKETVPESLKVLDAAARRFGFTLDFAHYDWSCETYKRTGAMMPADGMEKLAEVGFDPARRGGLAGRAGPCSLWGLLIPIRRGFDQYVNLRPCKLMPGVRTPLAGRTEADIDFYVVRENTEGEYSSVGGRMFQGTEREFVSQQSVFSREGRRSRAALCVRVGGFAAEAAFDVGHQVERHHVYHAVLGRAVRRDGRGYPEIRTDQYHIDILCAHFVQHPDWFDVVVGSNLFGDILSDLGPAVAGSIGIAPSANINPERVFPSMFEPVHGSAPDIAGHVSFATRSARSGRRR